MSREDIEKQFELQFKDKTPEEMVEMGRQIAVKSMQEERTNNFSKIQALRAMFNIGSPVPSDRFKPKTTPK